MARRYRRAIATQPKSGNAAERDGSDLGDGCGAEQDEHRRHNRDRSALAIRTQRARHAPNGLRDDGDGDEPEAMQQARSSRPVQRFGAISEEDERNRRRQRKGGPRRKCAGIARTHESDRKSGLARRRPRQELTQRDKIGIGLFVEPFATHDEFLTEIAEMGDRTAEACQPEPQEGAKDFPGLAACRRRAGAGTGVLVHAVLVTSICSRHFEQTFVRLDVLWSNIPIPQANLIEYSSVCRHLNHHI